MDIPGFESDLPTILTYHKIGPHLELGITTVRRERFAGHMDVLIGSAVEFRGSWVIRSMRPVSSGAKSIIL